MAQNVTLYNLLISCPGDIKEEVMLIESSVEEFNELYAETLGITIKTRHWSKSSYARSGGKSQALLNEQFVSKCDAAVAIFWTRFGSPTDEYGSGTEEEIEIMLQSGKQVFMYFSDKPISPSEMNSDGYKKIQVFRNKYADRGLYSTYSSNEEFRKMFFAHLSMHFLAAKKIDETVTEHFSKLKLLGIDENGKLSEKVSVYPVRLNSKTTTQEYVSLIRTMYQEISSMNVGGRTENTLFVGFTNPVIIEEKEKKLLATVAESLNCKVSDSFFELGNLNRDTIPSNIYGGAKLNGSQEEQQKYRRIKKLHETISKFLDWVPIENAFLEMKCIRLAVQNYGKAVDEDVEITFEIPNESIITLNEFPQFSDAEKRYLLDKCDLNVLFGINSTDEYIEYLESEKNGKIYYNTYSFELLRYVSDYEEKFANRLRDVFCYSIYSKGNKWIFKLKVDYIKHNTVVAFPTILLVKNNITRIPYRITSKNNPEVVESIIWVNNNEEKA